MSGGRGAAARRVPRKAIVLAAFLAAAALGFAALGVWQIERRAWKLALIDRVEARLREPFGPPPGRPVTREADEYRRLAVDGSFAHEGETLVQAVTEHGAGFWVVTPLSRPDGTAMLVNRGFVPADRRSPASRMAGQVTGPVTVRGLLRINEPGGAFLRSNDPAAERWYSRDVAAIAAARGLARVAPYFVDADASPNPGGLPIGGLTVIAFRNTHLVYALTWFALAAMAAGGAWLFARERSAPRAT